MKILAVCILAFALSSCGKKSHHKNTKHPLRIAFANEARTLDPRLGGEYPTSHLIRMLFDGLMRLDAQGKIAPAVAEWYEVSDDHRAYIFHLRDSYWTDGEPVTAYDFEYAWKKSLNPETLSHGAQNFYFIKNAKLSAEGKISVAEVGVKALDDKTFKVELEYPAPYFLDATSCTLFYPIPKHLAEKDPNWAGAVDSSFVSNGPFRLQKWHRGNRVIVNKNDTYWDQEVVTLEEVQVNFVDDGMTQLYLYEKDEIDWVGAPIEQPHPEARQSLTLDPGYQSLECPSIFWIFVNTESFPLNNVDIRRALSVIIDRQSLVAHIQGGHGIAAGGIISPSFKMENPPHFSLEGKEKAEEVFQRGLKEQGLTVDSFPTLTVRYISTLEHHSRIAQIVQQCWQETFGIKVNLEQAEWPVHFTAVQKGDYQIGLMGWTSYLCDPIYMLQTFKYKKDMVNMSNWENEEYQRLLEASDHEPDPEKRRQLLISAEHVLMEEMPVMPLYFRNMEFAKNPKLVGVNLPPSGEIDFKFARFSQ